ncbi:glucokinase regulator family protein [Aspergillus terreus]|uniref:N-acetyl-D-glucosamine kinase n=1 Tax=Aspergillus terreus TaxID=33178 RepID=A0A5M3ZHF6_ASPTE|nr:hypothetical protein ATETN484_0017006400 [Aspergillus terreus]GFF21735.1 glucokinase regulator family protein [Aspergillus terreus]
MDLTTLGSLQTEAVNARTGNIDRIPTIDLCRVINAEDHQVAASVTPFLPQIAEAIDAVAVRVRRGGRVVYVGAGTSGRLGILDASEIPPTFAALPSQFIGLIAGGDAAIRRAQEGAEDSVSQGEADLAALQLDAALDSVIGIAASGRTPYVLGCMAFAKRIGCLTIGVACASPSAMSRSGDVDIMLSPLPGPEVVTGSTRLKAGTATKLVLNMLSTGTMIRIGKTYGNMMVDLVASNEKLKQRSRNILRRLSERCHSMDDSELDALLTKCNRSVKLSLLVAESGLTVDECQRDLDAVGGVLAKALKHRNCTSKSKIQNSGKRQFILSIDGGATKSAAVIVDEAGNVVGRGKAGACNLTDGQNIEQAVNTLVIAAQGAMEEARITPSSVASCFKAVWIGLAGIDRNRFREILTPKLQDAFGVSGEALRLTNDVDLLAGAMIQHAEVRSAVVVIAGTGSVAMRYEWDAQQQHPGRVARSGGWGHLLGDEGGGYAIGLQALKSAMSALEERRLGLRSLPLEPLHRAVLDRLGCGVSDGKGIDLVGEILVGHQETNIKVRIASLAEVVLNLSSTDEITKRIVEEQVKQLVETTVGRLIHPGCSGFTASEQTGLLLSGSLLGHDEYRKVFLQHLEAHFAYVEHIREAAVVGAQSLTVVEVKEKHNRVT